jgi:hypothetical protein
VNRLRAADSATIRDWRRGAGCSNGPGACSSASTSAVNLLIQGETAARCVLWLVFTAAGNRQQGHAWMPAASCQGAHLRTGAYAAHLTRWRLSAPLTAQERGNSRDTAGAQAEETVFRSAVSRTALPAVTSVRGPQLTTALPGEWSHCSG